MVQLFYIAFGGSIGASARYLSIKVIEKLIHSNFPLGVLLVNVLGSFMISYIFFLYEEYFLPNNIKSMISVGFLGAFTTFSTYSMETFVMFKNGSIKMGIANIILNNGLCLGVTLLGLYCALITNKLIHK